MLNFLKELYAINPTAFNACGTIVLTWVVTNLINLVAKYDPEVAGTLRRVIFTTSVTTDPSKPVYVLKVPFKGDGAPPTIPPNILLVAWVLLAFSGCTYCMKPANKNTNECKAYRAITDCGPSAAAIIMAEVQRGMDAKSIDELIFRILDDLYLKAPMEYACVKQAIDDGVTKKFGASSPERQHFVQLVTRLEVAQAAKKR